jgi:hypothetical protein
LWLETAVRDRDQDLLCRERGYTFASEREDEIRAVKPGDLRVPVDGGRQS